MRASPHALSEKWSAPAAEMCFPARCFRAHERKELNGNFFETPKVPYEEEGHGHAEARRTRRRGCRSKRLAFARRCGMHAVSTPRSPRLRVLIFLPRPQERREADFKFFLEGGYPIEFFGSNRGEEAPQILKTNNLLKHREFLRISPTAAPRVNRRNASGNRWSALEKTIY